MQRRPRAPKNYISDGDDNNVRTKYRGPEYTPGDAMKIILTQIYDLMFIDGFQKHEVLGLIRATIDEHVEETDLAKE
jgi:hypothetical protein